MSVIVSRLLLLDASAPGNCTVPCELASSWLQPTLTRTMRRDAGPELDRALRPCADDLQAGYHRLARLLGEPSKRAGRQLTT
jgi:hypothetical protein